MNMNDAVIVAVVAPAAAAAEETRITTGQNSRQP